MRHEEYGSPQNYERPRFLRTKVTLALASVLLESMLEKSSDDDVAAAQERVRQAKEAAKLKEQQEVAAAQKRAREASARRRLQPRGDTKW